MRPIAAVVDVAAGNPVARSRRQRAGRLGDGLNQRGSRRIVGPPQVADLHVDRHRVRSPEREADSWRLRAGGAVMLLGAEAPPVVQVVDFVLVRDIGQSKASRALLRVRPRDLHRHRPAAHGMRVVDLDAPAKLLAGMRRVEVHGRRICRAAVIAARAVHRLRRPLSRGAAGAIPTAAEPHRGEEVRGEAGHERESHSVGRPGRRVLAHSDASREPFIRGYRR